MPLNIKSSFEIIIFATMIMGTFLLPIFGYSGEKLDNPGLKCMSPPAYYPGAGIIFTRRVADDCAYLNPDMLRVEFIAENDAENNINYPAYDYIVDQAAKRDMKILGLIDYSSLASSSSDEWETEEFRNRYTQRVREIVTHYSNRQNKIRHWEIWNEPDLDIGFPDWRIEPPYYALLLIDAYHAVKDIDQGSSVVLGGISPKGFEYSENYLSDLYGCDAMQDHYETYGYYPFDIVACHPYPEYFQSPDPTLTRILNNRIKAIMNNYGDRHKKVWLTEMGWSSWYVTEEQQAQYLEESYHMLDDLRDPDHPEDPPYVERYFWFRYSDFGGADLWGLWTEDLSRKKPAYDAYLNLTKPGPEPSIDPPGPGESSPVWNALSDSALPFQVLDDDLINGKISTIASGGFHSANQGNVEDLTDGLFNSNPLTLVLQDYGYPALSVTYTFQTPVDIREVRTFAGHSSDGGNRAFQSVDIYINGEPGAVDLTTGPYGQVSGGDSAVSLIRWIPTEGDEFTATDVSNLKIVFWCTSSLTKEFRDRWSPLSNPEMDIDGAGRAYVAPVIKEIDVIGEIRRPSEENGFMFY